MAEALIDAVEPQIDHRCRIEREHLAENEAPMIEMPSGLRNCISLRRFELVKEYVHAHLADELSVVDFSGLAEMGVDHFIRSFKQLTGDPLSVHTAPTHEQSGGIAP